MNGRRVPVRSVLNASTESNIDTAFEALVQKRAVALTVAADPFFNSRRQQIVALAARHALSTIYEWREFAVAGGLMSYGTIVFAIGGDPVAESSLLQLWRLTMQAYH